MKRIAPEEAFLQQVMDFAKIQGWRRAHFRPAKTAKGWRTPVSGDAKGFPDLLLIRPRTGHRLVAELKVPPTSAPRTKSSGWRPAKRAASPRTLGPRQTGRKSSASSSADHDLIF